MLKDIFYRIIIAITLLSISISANADNITPTSWTTYQQGNATSIIDANGNISLYARGVSYSAAVADLGNLNGLINVTFNYTTSVNGWWEDVTSRILTSNSGSFSIPNNVGNVIDASPNIQIQAYGNTSGVLTADILVDGPTQFILEITPNNMSSMGDHMGTNFNVSNLVITSVNPVPEAATSAMLLMGAGVMGFIARRRKQVAA